MRAFRASRALIDARIDPIPCFSLFNREFFRREQFLPDCVIRQRDFSVQYFSQWLRKEGGATNPASLRGGPMTVRTVHYVVAAAGKAAGIKFPVHPHMRRHATGFYLANAGQDTRAIQLYLGHKNIQHTVRYTELSSARFKDFWKGLTARRPHPLLRTTAQTRPRCRQLDINHQTWIELPRGGLVRIAHLICD